MKGFGRLSRYLWLVSSIFFIAAVFGYLYYSEAVRKEEYFNQLSFRELSEVSRGLEANMSRLTNFTRQIRSSIAGLQSSIKQLKVEVKKDSDSSEFEYIQGELKSYLIDTTWDELQAEITSSAINLYEDLGLYFDQTPTQFECDPSESNVPSSEPSSPERDAYCTELNLLFGFSGKFKTYIIGAQGSHNTDDMKSLLNLLNEKTAENEKKFVEGDRLEKKLEMWLEANYLANEIIDVLENGSWGFDEKEGEDFRRSYLPDLEAYSAGFTSDKLRKALTGKQCQICTQGQRDSFVSLVREELEEQEKIARRDFDALFYGVMVGGVAGELRSMRNDFSNFIKMSAKSDLDIAQQRLDNYMGKTIYKSTAAHDLRPRFLAGEPCPRSWHDRACDKKLFLSKTKKPSPYPGNKLSVYSYLPKTELIDSSEAAPIGGSEGGLFEASLEALLPDELYEFSTLVIAASDGSVLQQVDSGSDVVSHKLLSVSQFVREAIRRQADSNSKVDSAGAHKSAKLEGSADDGASLLLTAYVDQDIGGIPHRVYIYPHKISELNLYIGGNVKAEQLIYVIGVKPLSRINDEKFSISSETSVILLSAALGLLLALVFLKIQLAHIDASFTRLEGSVTAASVVLLLVIAIIGSFSLALSIEIESSLRSDAETSLSLLKKRFRTEIESHIVQIDALLRTNNAVVGVLDGSGSGVDTDLGKGFGTKACLAGPSADERYLTRNLPPNLGAERSSPLENLFMLNDKGRLTGPLLRGSRHMVRRSNPDLSDRKYFQHALANEVWEVQVKEPGSHRYWLCNANPRDANATAQWFPIYLERIFNLGDGSLNTQISIPVRHYFTGVEVFDAVSRYGISSDKPKVISAGLTLRTFKKPIMPRGQGFAVVENSTGLVLYHSDDHRARVENFFQETENDLLLRALIENSPSQNGEIDVEHSNFTGLYRGNRTEFFVNKLHPAIPWTLVVYKDTATGQDIVSVIFSVAMLITISVMLAITLLLALTSLMKQHIINWLWPRTGAQKLYFKVSVAAILATPVYYLLLELAFDNLGLMALIAIIIAVTALILCVLRYLFLQVEPPGNNVTTENVQGTYVLFVMSLLLLFTIAPTVNITGKVISEVLQDVTAFDAVQQQKSAEAADVANAKHMNRLCGSHAYKQSKFDDCASIQPTLVLGSEEIQKLESAENIPRGTVSKELLRPTRLVDVPQDCGEGRVPCGKVGGNKESGQGIGGSGVISFPLELLRRSRWELPVILGAVSTPGGDKSAVTNSDISPVYSQSKKFSSFCYLLLNHPLAMLLMISAILVTASIVRFLSVRLLGIAVPRSYRASYLKLNNSNWADFASGKGKMYQNDFEKDYDVLRTQLTTGDRKLAILIRPTQARLDKLLTDMEAEAIHLEGDRAPLDCHSLGAIKHKRTLLDEQLLKSTAKRRVLILESLEAVAFDSSKRMVILDLLEEVTNSGADVSVMLVCDVAPLYMLTHQDRYVPNSMEKECANAQESLRWSRLLSQFDKYYGWSPKDIEFIDNSDWTNTLMHECSAWPELYYLKNDLDSLRKQRPGITQEQVIQYISTHAGPVYRRRWSFCTKEEKLLLYQLSKGQMINPMNAEPLEHLMRRGYIRRDPKWSVVNESFSRFVLSAEEENTYLKWMNASEQGLWKLLRVPLVTVALMILGILMYSAQDTMESMLALATSVLAFLPLLLRNMSLVSGVKDAPPPAS